LRQRLRRPRAARDSRFRRRYSARSPASRKSSSSLADEPCVPASGSRVGVCAGPGTHRALTRRPAHVRTGAQARVVLDGVCVDVARDFGSHRTSLCGPRAGLAAVPLALGKASVRGPAGPPGAWPAPPVPTRAIGCPDLRGARPGPGRSVPRVALCRHRHGGNTCPVSASLESPNGTLRHAPRGRDANSSRQFF